MNGKKQNFYEYIRSGWVRSVFVNPDERGSSKYVTMSKSWKNGLGKNTVIRNILDQNQIGVGSNSDKEPFFLSHWVRERLAPGVFDDRCLRSALVRIRACCNCPSLTSRYTRRRTGLRRVVSHGPSFLLSSAVGVVSPIGLHCCK